jgi:hypothetical protein
MNRLNYCKRSEGELSERVAADDLAPRIRAGVKTTLTDKRQLSAQRWLSNRLWLTDLTHGVTSAPMPPWQSMV